MKKKQHFLLLLSSMFWATTLFAQIDNLNCVSADFGRTGARNAATDAADIVVYNPAGLVKLEDGIHINIGDNMFFRKPTHEYTTLSGQKKYSQESPDLVVPNLFAAYKKDKYSVFGGVYISGGGGAVDYPDGSISTDLIGMMALAGAGGAYAGTSNQFLKATSFYVTPTLGFAYAINEKFSAALSVKYLIAINNVKGGLTLTNSPISLPDMPLKLEYKSNASGVGFTAGLNYKVSEKLNVALRYETKVSLEFEVDSTIDNMGIIQDGQKSRRDLPAVLALGAEYKLTDKLTALVDFNYWFQKQADWDTLTGGKEISKLAGDATRLALGAGYKVNDKLEANIVLAYVWFLYPNEADKSAYYTNNLGTFETIKDNNLFIGIGAKYAFSKAVNINVAIGDMIWGENKFTNPYGAGFDVTTKGNIMSFSIGANLLF